MSFLKKYLIRIIVVKPLVLIIKGFGSSIMIINNNKKMELCEKHRSVHGAELKTPGSCVLLHVYYSFKFIYYVHRVHAGPAPIKCGPIIINILCHSITGMQVICKILIFYICILYIMMAVVSDITDSSNL